MGYEDFLANILVKQCLPVLVYDLNLWYWHRLVPGLYYTNDILEYSVEEQV